MTFTGTQANVNNALDGLSTCGTLNYNGPDTITFTVDDQGFTGTGGARATRTRSAITVNPVNDAPSFVKGPDQTGIQNQTADGSSNPQTVNPWATSISTGGGAAESGQTVHFDVTNDNPTLFSLQPAVSPSGVLTYTPDTAQRGTATVSVTAIDDGGTANGGDDTSGIDLHDHHHLPRARRRERPRDGEHGDYAATSASRSTSRRASACSPTTLASAATSAATARPPRPSRRRSGSPPRRPTVAP